MSLQVPTAVLIVREILVLGKIMKLSTLVKPVVVLGNNLSPSSSWYTSRCPAAPGFSRRP